MITHIPCLGALKLISHWYSILTLAPFVVRKSLAFYKLEGTGKRNANTQIALPYSMTFTYSLSLSHAQSHALSITLSHTRTHTHSLSHTQRHSRSLYHTHTRTLSTLFHVFCDILLSYSLFLCSFVCLFICLFVSADRYRTISQRYQWKANTVKCSPVTSR